MKKTMFSIRVYKLAEQQNISQVMVHEIISSFINYCRYCLVHGEKVDLLGLVSLVPDVIHTEYNTTLAFECEYIANELGLPSHTVYVIVKEYLNSLIDELYAGKPIELRGLVAMHPLKRDGVVCKVHSAISVTLKDLLSNVNTDVTSIRAHTHKILKYNIAKNLKQVDL